MYYDPRGRDAEILYKSDPFPVGHLALIVQDHSRSWWYFSWSSHNVDFKKVDKKYMSSLHSFNKLVAYPYTKMVYAEGNTSKAYEYCRKLCYDYDNRWNKDLWLIGKSNTVYDGLVNNCAQVVLKALSISFPKVRNFSGWFGVYNTLPSVCYSQCASLFRNETIIHTIKLMQYG